MVLKTDTNIIALTMLSKIILHTDHHGNEVGKCLKRSICSCLQLYPALSVSSIILPLFYLTLLPPCFCMYSPRSNQDASSQHAFSSATQAETAGGLLFCQIIKE